MTKYTLQESCDYAVQQMVAQGGQCVNDRDNCSYRNDDDENNISHCAVGHIMKLWGEVENSRVWDASGKVRDVIGFTEDKDLALFLRLHEHTLITLQSFHDSDTKHIREVRLSTLTHADKIDTSGEHWQQWVNMGE